MMRNVNIAAAIGEILAVRTEKAAFSVQRVDKAIAMLALSDIRRLHREGGSLLPPHEWPEDIAAVGARVAALVGGGADEKVVGFPGRK